MKIVKEIFRKSRLSVNRHGFDISNDDVWTWREYHSLTLKELEESERFYTYLECIHAIYAEKLENLIAIRRVIPDWSRNYHVKKDFHKNYIINDLR